MRPNVSLAYTVLTPGGRRFPVPGFESYRGGTEMYSTAYVSLTHNHRLQRLSLGYGLSAAQNEWSRLSGGHYSPPEPGEEGLLTNRFTFGLQFNAYFYATPHFAIGAVYRPDVYTRYVSDPFRYEHFLSLDIAFKLRLRHK